MSRVAMPVPDPGYVCVDHCKSQNRGEFFFFAVAQQISASDSMVSAK
jgi:hypothetical protein